MADEGHTYISVFTIIKKKPLNRLLNTGRAMKYKLMMLLVMGVEI